MWWFLKKVHNAANTEKISPSVWAQGRLLAQVPDLQALDGHEIAIKFWMPEQVAITLKWVADYEGTSQSAWVRERLLSYVYGQVAQLARKIRAEDNKTMFSRSPVNRGAGRWVYKVPQLGKNTIAFKLWVSQQMRDDLEILAKHAGVGLSPFVREALMGDLLGRGSLPERPQIMGYPSPTALAWERGDEVPVEWLEAPAFDDLGEAERVWLEDR